MKSDVQLNCEIYNPIAIRRAIQDYKNLASIRTKKEGDYLFLFFSRCRFDKEKTVRLFCNYLIDLMNSKE